MAAYTKQTWDTTSIFNPTRMNHIEQGIYDASTNIVDDLTSTDATSALSSKQGKVLNDRLKPVEIIKTKVFFNQSSLVFDLGFTPTSQKSATGFIVNGNQQCFALLRIDTSPSITKLSGGMTLSISISGSEVTITSNSTLWGVTEVQFVSN